MTQRDRTSRFLRRLAEAPWLITDTHTAVFKNARELTALEERLSALERTQLEALTLLTRAINELNSRLERVSGIEERSTQA